MKSRAPLGLLFSVALLAAVSGWHRNAGATVYIQYFATGWKEIQARLPEIAQAGYGVIWLPPPNKGCEGTADVGYAVYDRFDLGDKDQRGTVRTRHGNREELVALTKALHRMGLKVVFDVVMNHDGNPERIENTYMTMLTPVPIDKYPHTQVGDFHLLPGRTFDGGKTYEVKRPDEAGGGTMWIKPLTPQNPEEFVAAIPIPSNMSFPGYTHLVRAPWSDYSTIFIDEHYSLLGLIDFAIEQHLNSSKTGPDPATDGKNDLLGTPLPRFIRQPDCKECYPNDTPVAEDIREYMHRWIWWLGKVTDADGFRLDAIKHVPPAFYNYDFPGDKVAYNKFIQDDYDARRGFTDTNDNDGIQDAIIFGESYTGDIYGALKPYRDTGMLLLNFPLMFKLLDIFGAKKAGSGDIGQLSFPHGDAVGALEEFGGLGRRDGVHFSQSHDQRPPDLQEDVALAFVLTRPGDSVVFFDGNNYDAKSWVAPGRADALGDIDEIVRTLVYIHNHYARGGMFNRYTDDDAYVYERVVDGKGATLLMVLNDNIGDDGRVGPDGVARFGAYDPRPLVVTAFPPGTKLVELTGNSPVAETTVTSPGALPANQVDAAKAQYALATANAPLPPNFGLVHVAVPSGPNKNYAAYGIAGPRLPSNGSRPVRINQAGQRVEDVSVETVGARRTASGVRVPARRLLLPRVTGKVVDVELRVGPTADVAYLRIDTGTSTVAGVTAEKSSPEGLWDGFVTLKRDAAQTGGDVTFRLNQIDVSSLADGKHLLLVRAVDNVAGGPPVFATFTVPFIVDRTLTPPSITDPADVDGDGVVNEKDNCPRVRNELQTDFDGDKIGDLCDLCPTRAAAPGEILDADGCVAPSTDQLTQVDAIVGAIRAQQSGDRALDVNGDGRVDMLDLVKQVDAIHAN